MTLEVITAAPLQGLRHGFFTRKGGASSGIFEGLNCGQGSSDQQSAVRTNRFRVAEHLGVELLSLVSLHQVHSPDVMVLHRPPLDRPKADAMVTREPGLALGILTADCSPVLFADLGAGVVGAAHAGWKGAISGVLENTVEAMVHLGATRANITAVVGPLIAQGSYEVGPEFMDQFADQDPDNTRFFAGGTGDRMQFDLPGFVLHRLRNTGVTAMWTGHDTYADPERFFSYRRSVHAGEADYGRLISAICL